MPSRKSKDEQLPTRTAYHPARKFFHFSTGVAFAIANENLSRPTCVTLTFFLFVTVLIVETLRIRSPHGRLNTYVISMFRPFLRAHETRAFAGVVYYLFGVWITCALFPRSAASLGILSLASLDPIAAFAGTLFSSTDRLPSLRLSHGKSLAGLVSAAAVAATVLYSVITSAESSSMTADDAWMLAVIVGWAGALTELFVPSPQVIFGNSQFPIGVDDNALIPIVCAAVAKYVLRVSFHRLDLSPTLI